MQKNLLFLEFYNHKKQACFIMAATFLSTLKRGKRGEIEMPNLYQVLLPDFYGFFPLSKFMCLKYFEIQSLDILKV